MNSTVKPSRKEVIDHFLADLSPPEILYLQEQVHHIIITQLPSVPSLPSELVCIILLYLDLDDYRSCTQVSREWRRSWLHRDTVLTWALRQFFPGLLETHPEESAQVLYSLATTKLLKWRLPYSRQKWLEWDERPCNIFTDPNEISDEFSDKVSDKLGDKFGDKVDDESATKVSYPFLYNQKKLAWQPQLDRVIVDDLCTRQRQWIVPPRSAMSGARYQTLAVSDQLLVLLELDQHDRKVYVTDLAGTGWKILTLPAPLANAYVDAKTLHLEKIDIRPTGSNPMFGGVPKVLLHPTEDGVLFGVWAYSHECRDKRLCTFVVVEFQDGKAVWQSTRSITNPLRNPQENCQASNELALSFDCRKSDNSGSFSIALYRFQEYGRRKGDLGVLTFNALTHTFHHHDYLSPSPDIYWDGPFSDITLRWPSTIALADMYFWNRNLLLAVATDSNEGEVDVHIETAHDPGRRRNYSLRLTPIRIRDDSQVGRTQIFLDDDFVIFPTVDGVVLFEPSKSKPLGVVKDTVHGYPATPPRPVTRFGQAVQVIDLKHGEAD
ncbi:hypothetical protein F66182_8535 [Fusarium sp. NRRL 66182]|nr:hypothetical protein F66182_8535 [Fusarium sp. NRRL 66182]